MVLKYNFKAELWLYHGDGAWVFITLPKDISEEIKQITKDLPRRGFGSLKVTVTIGDTVWNTSIFPDTKSSSYLLPIKKAVREKEQISVGDKAKISLIIKDIA